MPDSIQITKDEIRDELTPVIGYPLADEFTEFLMDEVGIKQVIQEYAVMACNSRPDLLVAMTQAVRENFGDWYQATHPYPPEEPSTMKVF